MANLAGVLAKSGKQFYKGKPISPEECQQDGLAPYLPSPELINACQPRYLSGETPPVAQGGTGMR
jgi:hypothetical protein